METAKEKAKRLARETNDEQTRVLRSGMTKDQMKAELRLHVRMGDSRGSLDKWGLSKELARQRVMDRELGLNQHGVPEAK